MKTNFLPSLALVLKSEGGYVDNPADRGGATNLGVTQAVYDDWRVSQGLPKQSVRLLSRGAAAIIYAGQYWHPVRGDDLPAGVDYAVFDMAVNSGVGRASRFLQRAAGVAQDARIGPETLAAVKAIPPLTVIDTLCDERVAYLQTLSNFATFGKGWLNRVADVRANAKAMAA